jgi:ABC-type nitrate/sulfonate/bicarbonate transport system permease component
MSQTSRTLPRPLGQPAERGRRRVFRKARRKDPDFWTVVGLRVLLVAIFCALWQLAPDGVVPESAVGRWLLGPAISLLYAIPKVGLIAVFVILLGVERSSHVALVVSAVLFVYFYAIRQGIEEVNEDQLNALRGMGAGPLTVLRKLILPSAVPQLLGATRIALPLALTSEIFAELREPSIAGLGTLLADSSQSLNGAAASAVLIVTVLIAYGLDIVLNSRVKGFTELTGTGLQV